MLTIDQFKALFPQNKQPEIWTAAIGAVMPRYGLDTPLLLAMFLAQAGHESDGFTDLQENLNYSAEGLAATWPNRYAVDPKAKKKVPNELAKRLHRQPMAIANNCYANRMGNGDEASGDGWRFRGFGPFQLTGRGNREAFAAAIGKGLEESEAYLLTPEGGIESACWFWTAKGLTKPAADRRVEVCTRIINGGFNGLKERQALYTQACKIVGLG